MTERFQQSIDKYWQNRKILEYLDLAVEPKFETESIEGIEFSCYKKGFKHIYHSENRQLNLLCNLQLNTLHNISVIYDRLALLSKVCLKHFHSIEEKIKQLQKEIFNCEEIEKKIKRIPSKKEVAGLINSIVDQPKKIEQEAIQLTEHLEKKIQKVEHLLEQLQKQWI